MLESDSKSNSISSYDLSEIDREREEEHMLTDEYQIEQARAEFEKQVEAYKSQLPKKLLVKYYEGLTSDTHIKQHLNILKGSNKGSECCK